VLIIACVNLNYLKKLTSIYIKQMVNNNLEPTMTNKSTTDRSVAKCFVCYGPLKENDVGLVLAFQSYLERTYL
jgi:3-methyladenine DNA glycosylase AlkC